MKRTKLAGLIVTVIALLGAAYWYINEGSDTSKAPKKSPPVPVTVNKAVLKDMPVWLDVVGRAEAFESVTVKSRVDGQILSVTYTEGQHVKQGDVLVKLDPADYEARLQQARANQARDEAQLKKAAADVKRYEHLKEKGFVSTEKINEMRTAEAAAAATVRANQAATELAALQLSYTTVRAPFAGMVGARLVFPGSSVKTNDTALAVINRLSPIYVTFSVPEKHLSRLLGKLKAGPMQANVSIPGTQSFFQGKISFLDNAVDPATGTVMLKAVLENHNEMLRPGQFLNVRLKLDTLSQVVSVPTEAIQQGAEGSFIYVIGAEDKAEHRKVEILATDAGVAALLGQIAVGDRVVTDGQLRLVPGIKVQIKPSAAEAKTKPEQKPAPEARPKN